MRKLRDREFHFLEPDIPAREIQKFLGHRHHALDGVADHPVPFLGLLRREVHPFLQRFDREIDRAHRSTEIMDYRARHLPHHRKAFGMNRLLLRLVEFRAHHVECAGEIAELVAGDDLLEMFVGEVSPPDRDRRVHKMAHLPVNHDVVDDQAEHKGR